MGIELDNYLYLDENLTKPEDYRNIDQSLSDVAIDWEGIIPDNKLENAS